MTRFSALAAIGRSVREAMQPGDIVLFLGAGADVTVLAHDLASQLEGEIAGVLVRLNPS